MPEAVERRHYEDMVGIVLAALVVVETQYTEPQHSFTDPIEPHYESVVQAPFN